MDVLKVLKNKLDLLAMEPVKLAKLYGTEEAPDMYVESYTHGFLIEVKNWWSPRRYDIDTITRNIISKQWNNTQYQRRESDGHGSIIPMKDGKQAVPVLVVTQVDSWTRKAQEAVRGKFGQDLVITDHPIIPVHNQIDAECTLATGASIGFDLQKVIMRNR